MLSGSPLEHVCVCVAVDKQHSSTMISHYTGVAWKLTYSKWLIAKWCPRSISELLCIFFDSLLTLILRQLQLGVKPVVVIGGKLLAVDIKIEICSQLSVCNQVYYLKFMLEIKDEIWS